LGLGNPTDTYAATRHNVGFDAVNITTAFLNIKLRKRCFRLYKSASKRIGQTKSVFVQPLTYMNKSGEILPFFIPKKFNCSDLIVVCDNLDLGVGTIRIRKGGSTATHKGLKSIIETLGDDSFIRIYIGIGPPKEGVSVIEHVLGRPTEIQESEALKQALLLAKGALVKLCSGESVEEVANVYNRRKNSNRPT